MIPFNDYFTDWLYGKEGYYTTYRPIGKEGDFYTAVSSTPFFGGTIAYYFLRLLDEGKFDLENVWLIEIGAHRGYLTADVAQFIYTLRPELLGKLRFGIVERFDALREYQQQYLEQSFAGQLNVTLSPDIASFNAQEAFIFANEIFDAFPCALLKNNQSAFINNHTLSWQEASEKIATMAHDYGIITGELTLGIDSFAQELNVIPKAIFLTFDYGEAYPLNALTLRIFKDHHVYNFFDINLADYFASSDITYTVNFALIEGEMKKQGWEKVWFKRQMDALVFMGLDELLTFFSTKVSHEVYRREVSKLQTLLAPGMMGEIFKGIVFAKGY